MELVILDFNDKIESNTKKATKEKNLKEKAIMDLKEMEEQSPFFSNEKKVMVEQIDEEYLKKMSNI